MSTLAASNVLVLGLGESGLAMARWCARHGARDGARDGPQVRVWDSREAPPQAATLAHEWPEVQVFSGPLSAAAIHGVDLVLKSPGLAPHDPRIATLLDAARTASVPVRAELDLFTQALAELKASQGYAPKVVAISGTNGKTTTTAMTVLLVERAGHRVAVAGNIGPTLLDTLGSVMALDAAEWPQVWVLELSSFQLHDAATFEPDAAALLNITQDHLDWHGSMAAYTQAKARVFGTRGAMVVNADDAAVLALSLPNAPTNLPTKTPAKATRGKAATPRRSVQRFGLTPPQRPGDWGLVEENGMAWLVRAMPRDETIKTRPGVAEEIILQRLMPADALRVRGRHNAANALAALALASSIGCALAPMLHGLREYSGEPHRVQWVGAVGGVDAFDDSKGTNVGATVAALLGLGADKAPAKLVVILGGEGKGQDFAPLCEPLQRHARAVALIGRDADVIAAIVASADVPAQRHATLPEAVAWCFAQAHSGDAVLLSPACASLDMFRNYGHRAEVFVDAVRSLALERGEVVA